MIDMHNAISIPHEMYKMISFQFAQCKVKLIVKLVLGVIGKPGL